MISYTALVTYTYILADLFIWDENMLGSQSWNETMTIRGKDQVCVCANCSNSVDNVWSRPVSRISKTSNYFDFTVFTIDYLANRIAGGLTTPPASWRWPCGLIWCEWGTNWPRTSLPCDFHSVPGNRMRAPRWIRSRAVPSLLQDFVNWWYWWQSQILWLSCCSWA